MVAAQSHRPVLRELPMGLLEENEQCMEEDHLCTEKLLARDTFHLSPPQLGWPTSGAPEPAPDSQLRSQVLPTSPASSKATEPGSTLSLHYCLVK